MTIAQIATFVADLAPRVDAIAARLGTIRRPDSLKLSPGDLVASLVLGWLHQPHATLNQLVTAIERGGTAITAPALHYRLHEQTATLFRAVVQEVVRDWVVANPVPLPILTQFAMVQVTDSTIITVPDDLMEHMGRSTGNGGTASTAALKCGLQVDLSTGQITGLDLVAGRDNDRTLPCVTAPAEPDTLQLRDLGFFSCAAMARMQTEEAGWLSRLPSNTAVALKRRGRREPLTTFVPRVTTHGPWTGMVWIGTESAHVQVRLLAMPVPDAIAELRRSRIIARAKDKATPPSPSALALAAWTIVVTDQTEADLPMEAATALVAARWQIELLFKLWKSLGAIAVWRTRKPWRIACEIYAKLLGQLLQHTMIVAGCWHLPNRSLVKAAQIVQTEALNLQWNRHRACDLIPHLTRMLTLMARRATQDKRTKPSTADVLAAAKPPSTAVPSATRKHKEAEA